MLDFNHKARHLSLVLFFILEGLILFEKLQQKHKSIALQNRNTACKSSSSTICNLMMLYKGSQGRCAKEFFLSCFSIGDKISIIQIQGDVATTCIEELTCC